MAFADHFSEKSGQYAASRPTYPDALFAAIAAAAPGRERAWDCATGSGQAAVGLAAHFSQVDATDASGQQVANALAHPRVRYSVQPGERTDLPAGSFDAVTVAQALHWLDLDRFYAEVRRVLRPRGVIAAWAYDWSQVTPAVDFALERHLLVKIKPHWPEQVNRMQAGFMQMPFPFEPVAVPPVRIDVAWTLRQYLDYVETWSATRAYVAKHGRAVLDKTESAMREAWADAGTRNVTMPLHVRCGRHVES
jgi:ubiquinone/menaquinone biosynthesis C-methylase UbiE